MQRVASVYHLFFFLMRVGLQYSDTILWTLKLVNVKINI